MTPADDTTGLEARTIAAHRAYIDALTTWERLVEAGPTGSDNVHAEVREAAEVSKEDCRIAFRALLDELGYVPSGSNIGLPNEISLETIDQSS